MPTGHNILLIRLQEYEHVPLATGMLMHLHVGNYVMSSMDL